MCCHKHSNGESQNRRALLGMHCARSQTGGKDIDTVVATVWDVNDASTAVFMRRFRFYLHLANPDYTRSQALRQAQLDLLNNLWLEDEKERSLLGWLLDEKKQQSDLVNFENTQAAYGFSNYSHPYFWAPFIMMGKWR